MDRKFTPCLVVLFIVMFLGGCVNNVNASQGQSAPTADSPEVQPVEPAVIVPEEPAEQLTVVDQTITTSNVSVVTLSNGLTVIVKPLRTAPVVCVQASLKTGSIYENQWLGTGVSHLLEHLVAKGAVHDGGSGQAKKTEQTRDRVKDIGGQSNAFTSLAQTTYYISAAASKTTDCISLIVDWMARPEITEEDFNREHGVVQRELELGKDDAHRQSWYNHSANVFRGHPAGLPTIGIKAPLAALTYQEVLAYHRLTYIPQNMAFVVTGDVDVDAVIEQIRSEFAGFAPARPPNRTLPAVETFSGIRRTVRGQKDLKEVMQSMSFQTIPLLHEDLYALDVLSYVLTEGKSSRLIQAIKRDQQLVTSISSSSWTPAWGTGVFTFNFSTSSDKADPAEKAVIAQLKEIIESGVTETELTKAKRQKVADQVYPQQTAQSQARMLASDFLSTGDVEFSQNYTDQIQAVTAEQVQAMAEKYFTFDRMVISRLLPQEEFSATAATAAADAQRSTEMFTLPNGLRVVLHPTDAIELVSMTLVTAGGVLPETEQTNGMGTLMATLSTKGAGERTAEQIAEFFDTAGGSISGNCGNNTFYWRATVLDDSFDGALEIFADVVQRPTFTDKELQIARPPLVQAIKRQDQSLIGEAVKEGFGKFFTGSPFRMRPLGDVDVVEAATAEQIAAYHRENVKAGSSVMAIYGNFDAAVAREKIQELFAELPAGKVTLPDPPAQQLDEDILHIKQTKKTGSAVVVLIPGMKVDNPDRFAITVLDTIISGFRLPSGWLHSELRGKQLVYVVHAYNWPGLAPGAFITYAAGEPKNAPEIVDIIKANLTRASQYTPTQDEIDQAVNIILTAKLLEAQSMSELSMTAALNELYGFGYDFNSKLEQFYRQVTPADVLRVGEKYFGGKYFVVVTTPSPDIFKTASTENAPVEPAK